MLDPEVQWEVEIIRYLSILNKEEIDVLVSTTSEK